MVHRVNCIYGATTQVCSRSLHAALAPKLLLLSAALALHLPTCTWKACCAERPACCSCCLPRTCACSVHSVLRRAGSLMPGRLPSFCWLGRPTRPPGPSPLRSASATSAAAHRQGLLLKACVLCAWSWPLLPGPSACTSQQQQAGLPQLAAWRVRAAKPQGGTVSQPESGARACDTCCTCAASAPFPT